MSLDTPKIYNQIIDAIRKSLEATGKKPEEIHVTHKGYQQLLAFSQVLGLEKASHEYPLDCIKVMGVPVCVPPMVKKTVIVEYDVSYETSNTYRIDMHFLDGTREHLSVDKQSVYGETAKEFLMKRGYYFAKDS